MDIHMLRDLSVSIMQPSTVQPHTPSFSIRDIDCQADMQTHGTLPHKAGKSGMTASN